MIYDKNKKTVKAGLFYPPPKMVEDVAKFVFEALDAVLYVKTEEEISETNDKINKLYDKKKNVAPYLILLKRLRSRLADIKDSRKNYNYFGLSSPSYYKSFSSNSYSKIFKINTLNWNEYEQIYNRMSKFSLIEKEKILQKVNNIYKIHDKYGILVVFTSYVMNGAASWNEKSKILEIGLEGIESKVSKIVQKNDPRSDEGIYYNVTLEVIKHELSHFGQHYLKNLLFYINDEKDNNESSPGMPSKKILTPTIKQHLPRKDGLNPNDPDEIIRTKEYEKILKKFQLKKDIDFHALDDSEFYTNLKTAVEYFNIWKNYFNWDNKTSRIIALYIIGQHIIEKTTRKYKNTLSEITWFFDALKKYAPDKYKKAVKEFLKETIFKNVDEHPIIEGSTKQASPKKYIGYKVMAYINDKTYSLYDLNHGGKGFIPKKGLKLIDAKGIYIGSKRGFCDYYVGGTNYDDIILRIEYDVKDILKGNPDEENFTGSEIIIAKGKILDWEIVPNDN